MFEGFIDNKKYGPATTDFLVLIIPITLVYEITKWSSIIYIYFFRLYFLLLFLVLFLFFSFSVTENFIIVLRHSCY